MITLLYLYQIVKDNSIFSFDNHLSDSLQKGSSDWKFIKLSNRFLFTHSSQLIHVSNDTLYTYTCIWTHTDITQMLYTHIDTHIDSSLTHLGLSFYWIANGLLNLNRLLYFTYEFLIRQVVLSFINYKRILNIL